MMPPHHDPTPSLRFDRTISPALLAALTAGGPLHGLIERRQTAPRLLDVQLRRAAWGKRCWASLYYGLTSVLDVEESAGRYRLRAHPKHQETGGFQPSWAEWQPMAALTAAWPQVDRYLDRLLPNIGPRHTAREGAVHARMCSSSSPVYRVVNREAAVAFRDTAVKGQITRPLQDGIAAALAAPAGAAGWWARSVASRRPLGTGADLLAVDAARRLLVIEAKPAGSSAGITWGPAQVGYYARLFSLWVDADEQAAITTVDQMLDQRIQLGLAAPGLPGLWAPVRVVPVLAIGQGQRSSAAWDRLWSVADALHGWLQEDLRIDPLEVWQLDDAGEPESQHRGHDRRGGDGTSAKERRPRRSLPRAPE
jgi:hypothetical protein